MKLKTNDLTVTAIFSAIICILSVITIPIGTVPISLSLFAVMLSAISLGAKKGVLSCLVYILIGSLGIPVFSGFKGGFHILFGPTGGFIISYIFVSLIMSFASHKANKKLTLFIFGLLSLAVCYLLGCFQYSLISKVSFYNSLSVCVYPFVVFDILKIIFAVNIGIKLKKLI